MDIFVTDMTVNQRVVGSSPTGGAQKVKGLYFDSMTLFYVKILYL
jgi:hypothetical protein